MREIDPRLKILWFILYSTMIFLYDNLPSQILLMAFTLLGILVTGYKFGKIIKKIRYLLFFLPLTFLIHLLFSTAFLSQIFDHNLTEFKLSLFYLPTLYTLRIADFIIFMSWVLLWIPSDGILDSLYLILKPLKKIKIPIDDFFQIIFIAVRFFPILQEEYKKMEANWKNYTDNNEEENKFTKILNVLVTLMIFSFRKADKIAIAMKVRGYGKVARSYYTDLRFQSVDLYFFLFSIIFITTMQKVGVFFGSI